MSRNGLCQLPNGSIAPDWTLTDIDGNIHTLYDYLDQGKMVVFEFGETRCLPCWEYLNSGAMENFWEQHGPSGLDDAMVFFIEAAWETGMDHLLGLTENSFGNWVEACQFPLIDLAPGDSTGIHYEVSYYPTLYVVCQDRTTYEVGQLSTQEWIDFLESCSMQVQITDMEPAICAGEGSVTVGPVGGFSPYSFQWENGETTAAISGLVSGEYTVSVTEGNGKITTLDVFVPGATEALSISAVTEPALCFGAADGNIFLETEGGVAPYQFTWNNGAMGEHLLNIPSGLYFVTVTDDLGCTAEESFFVDQPDPLAAEVSTTPVGCDQDDGTITLNITGGTGNYGITSSAGNINENHITGLPLGLISVEVEDQNGCIWADVVMMESIDYPIVTVTEGAEVNCIQTTAVIAGFATGGYNEFDFHWTTIDGNIISNPLSSTIVVDDPGAYMLHVTDLTSGCETFETALVMDGSMPPEVDAGPSIPLNCENQQVILAASGDSMNLIQWTTVEGSILSGEDSYHPLINAPGTYMIHAIHAISNCYAADSVYISNESLPATSAFQYLTSGLSFAGMDQSTGSNLVDWLWTFGDGHISAEQHPVHTFDSAGIYQVCLVVENGCRSDTSCQWVTVALIPDVITVEASITHVSCYGERTGSISLLVNGGSGNYQYSWTGPDTTFTLPDITGLASGHYQLVVVDDSGNIFIGAYQVDQSSRIMVDSTILEHNLCYADRKGAVMLFIQGGVPPYNYTWNMGEPQSENIIQNLPGGFVTVEVSDIYGCSYRDSFLIHEPPPINIDSIKVVHASGAGKEDGAITIYVQGGTPPYQISWNNGQIGSFISNLPAGNYHYHIADVNGCEYFSSEPVLVMFSTALQDHDQVAEIIILHHSSNGKLIVEWKGATFKNANLKLITMDGRILAEDSVSCDRAGWEINTTQLPEGVYIVLFMPDGQMYPRKVVLTGR